MDKSNLLLENVKVFAGAVSQSICDMVGVESTVLEDSAGEELFKPDYEMSILIHFTGPIQGEYAVSVDEKTIASMIECYSEGMSREELIEMREDYGGFIKEALNASVGTAIENLSKEFEDLTFLPPVVVYGQIDYPLVPSGKVEVQNEHGNYQCFFVLNMMGLELGDRLQATLKELQEKAKEASSAKRNVEGMLEAIPSGMVIINKEGIVQPGFSKRTAETVGLEKDAPVAGEYFPDVLGFEEVPDVKKGFQPWLVMAWDKIEILGMNTIVDLCPVIDSFNKNGRYLSVDWYPRYDEENKLDSLMAIIEDQTEKKKQEEEMARLNEVHERNMEMVTQVLNLEADEVSDFLYDSSGLLNHAKTTILSATRDRKFIEELYRTVHTLKGNSGQYQFKGLQKLAADIENDLSLIKTLNEADADSIKDADFSSIDAGLQEANAYLERLEEMQVKLGGKEETLEQKAERSKPGVLVNFEKIDRALDSIDAIHTLVEKGKNEQVVDLVRRCGEQILQMKEVSVGQLQGILGGAVKRTSEKLGKEILFEVEGDVEIDIEVFRVLHRGFVHLLNNAIDHGIESPEEREDHGKLRTGLIQLTWKDLGDRVYFEMRDDGRGIDFEKALERYNESHGNHEGDVSNDILVKSLFKSGFTTRTEVSDYSGRGVGLDAVKHLIDDLGGTIKVESEKGQGTTFKFEVPIGRIIPSHSWGKESQ